MVIARKAKHPLTLLMAYSMLLNGSSDIEILSSGVKMADLAKIQRWHDCISQNMNYITVAYELSIDSKVARRLLTMREEHLQGKPVTYCVKRTQVIYAFRLLLDGLSDCEILEKRVSVSDIEPAKKFMYVVPHAEKHLLSTIGKQFNISTNTVSKMLRIYRDKQAERMQPETIENRILIQITA
jgi:hypothetical protein